MKQRRGSRNAGATETSASWYTVGIGGQARSGKDTLGAYLVQHGKLSPAQTFYILQGVEMGRPSQIEVAVSQTGKKLVPRVSGAAVKVFEGTIRV